MYKYSLIVLLDTVKELKEININEGAIPNIQMAWQYLCEDECVKAVNLSTDYYD